MPRSGVPHGGEYMSGILKRGCTGRLNSGVAIEAHELVDMDAACLMAGSDWILGVMGAGNGAAAGEACGGMSNAWPRSSVDDACED